MTEKISLRCVSNAAYLTMDDDGVLVEGVHPNQKLTNLTVGKIYRGTVEGEYVRVWDDFNEDYLYPRDHFEIVT